MIAAAALTALAAFIFAANQIDHDPKAALTDPNLETIKYIGRAHADERFKFADRPASAATVHSSN